MNPMNLEAYGNTHLLRNSKQQITKYGKDCKCDGFVGDTAMEKYRCYQGLEPSIKNVLQGKAVAVKNVIDELLAV